MDKKENNGYRGIDIISMFCRILIKTRILSSFYLYFRISQYNIDISIHDTPE